MKWEVGLQGPRKMEDESSLTAEYIRCAWGGG